MIHNTHNMRTALATLFVLLVYSTTSHAQHLMPPTDLAVEITVEGNIPGTTIPAYHATLTWKSDGAAKAFNVYVKRFADPTPTFEKLSTTRETRMVIDAQLDIAGAGYAYYVTAVADNMESDPSNIVSTACGRAFNEGDLSRYDGGGSTRFVSDPPMKARVGSRYRYDANVVGETIAAERDRIRFSLERAPDGMTIDASTGVITWTPRAEGSYSIAVAASTDESTNNNRQTWTIDASAQGSAAVAWTGSEDRAAAYPNPATSTVTFRLPKHVAGATARVIDIKGAALSGTPLNASEDEITVDVRGLASGLYFLQVETAAEPVAIPFSVTR